MMCLLHLIVLLICIGGGGGDYITRNQKVQTNNGVSMFYCIDGVVIAALMHCDLFKIYCAPPNFRYY